jgi:cell division protein FtsI/penicillin-binding protein 2
MSLKKWIISVFLFFLVVVIIFIGVIAYLGKDVSSDEKALMKKYAYMEQIVKRIPKENILVYSYVDKITQTDKIKFVIDLNNTALPKEYFNTIERLGRESPDCGNCPIVIQLLNKELCNVN